MSIFSKPRVFATARLAFGVTLLPAHPGFAQTATKGKAMLVLDASGSMWGQIDGVAKISIARDVIDDVLGEWDQGVELGLMAYGHRRKGDCTDIELVAPVGPLNADGFAKTVRGLSPKGKTPISEALFLAAKELRHVEDPASVILVSDGLETCDTDPCVMAQLLEESGIDFKVHVVGFDLTKEEAEKLQCISDITGGKYLSADNATELTQALSETVTTISEEVTAQKPPEPEPVKVPAVIADIDLSKLSFDVQTLEKDQASGKVIATGTSNGVGWTVTANNIFAPLTNMSGGATFNDLPGNFDDLHVGSDFTITFDQKVTSMLVVLGNDNDTGDGPNFQELSPVDFLDAEAPDGGTQVKVLDRGGALFYYRDIEITQMTHVNDNGINDGWDLAFFVFPTAD